MHEISIPQNILDACLKRRGRRFVFDAIDIKRTALVVIDMQNAWLEPGLSILEIPQARSIVPNINLLASEIRNAGGTVAWTQSTFGQTWTRKMYENFCDSKWTEQIIADSKPGTHGFALSAKMGVHEADIISVKNRPSALIQGASDLNEQLKARNCDTIIVTGTLTNACCESTTRDAVALGYKAIFVSDGTATRSDIEHNATLINLMQLVADVRTTSEVLPLIKGT